MSLRDRVLSWLTKGAAMEPGYRWPDWQLATAAAQQTHLPEYALADTQARTYQQLSWINAAVGTVARSVALQPLRVFTLDGEQRQGVDNHPFETLLNRPNPLMSRYEFIYSLVAWIKLTGNAYVWLNRLGPKQPPEEMWIIPTNRMKPVPDGHLYLKGYAYDPGDGNMQALDVGDVVHVRNFHPSNQWLGASDIEALAWAAEGDWHMARWNSKFFDKDNAKFPGILTFAESIPDQTWAQMQREFKDASGSSNRSLRMLRGVGNGSVNWVQTTVSQRDMEFLEGRAFNRDEIYSVMAPGLASITSVNATEANAVAGRATLVSQAVWPTCVMIAEKFANDVLPYYGEGLVCEFDDPRVGDRSIELEERRLFQYVHTVAEVRDKYDGDQPLGDERDDLLVPQVDKLGQRAEPGETPPQLATFTGEAPAQEQDEPKPDPEDDDSGDMERERQEETAKWRRYALKRGGEDGAAFKCEHLPDDVAEVIRQRLLLAQSDMEVKAAFVGPFLTKAERVTSGGLLDPFGSEKDKAERRLIRLLRARLNGQFEQVMNLLGNPPDMANLPADFWSTATGVMLADVRPEMESLARVVVEGAIESGVGIAWDLANEAAIEWAERYTYDLIRGITETTQRQVQRAVTRFFETPGETRANLEARLAPWFGQARASSIAVTEVTRASGEGVRVSYEQAKQAGINMVPVWHTARDELVCSVCGPNDNKLMPEWQNVSWTPAHVNCRCWITLRYVPS